MCLLSKDFGPRLRVPSSRAGPGTSPTRGLGLCLLCPCCPPSSPQPDCGTGGGTQELGGHEAVPPEVDSTQARLPLHPVGGAQGGTRVPKSPWQFGRAGATVGHQADSGASCQKQLSQGTTPAHVPGLNCGHAVPTPAVFNAPICPLTVPHWPLKDSRRDCPTAPPWKCLLGCEAGTPERLPGRGRGRVLGLSGAGAGALGFVAGGAGRRAAPSPLRKVEAGTKPHPQELSLLTQVLP